MHFPQDIVRVGSAPILIQIKQPYAWKRNLSSSFNQHLGKCTMAQSQTNGNATELFNSFNETSRRWLGCVEAEAKLTSELAAKLIQARSFPDIMAAYQQWGTRQLEMIAGEAKHLLNDAQNLMQSGAHIALTSWQSNGPDIST